jgi:hypothetical protein
MNPAFNALQLVSLSEPGICFRPRVNIYDADHVGGGGRPARVSEICDGRIFGIKGSRRLDTTERRR